ncbi:metal dependent phosphohydrolase [Xylogone sp. PMI_703]|nr:metal dependent phosphohydrolase [Xylogone sp. PMI_703]
MSSSSPLPTLPKSGLSLSDTPLIRGALEHCRRYTSPTTVNHCIRSAYYAVLLSRKVPPGSAEPLDLELVVYSNIMHDLGWAVDKSLLSKDKRFEVDGADMARTYLQEVDKAGDWDKHRIQLMWDAIAMHAEPTFALHKQPEVKLAHMGIMADFWGPNLSGGMITVDEHKEIVATFPRLGFRDQFIQIMCGLCALKPGTTYGNFVSEYGCDTSKEQFTREKHANSMQVLKAVTACLEHYES